VVLRLLARAARRFVKLEYLNKRKPEAEFLTVRKLPKHWGELKINNKWVKF
jgi:hypothetical protein